MSTSKSSASAQVYIQGILGSTRQGRFGETVARWFTDLANKREDMTFELLDLRDWPLPFFDHPKAPTSGEIAPEARTWSEKIKMADGYVLISPEYNRGYPAVLKNALDHLWYEWNDKPVGLVGYGGAVGGGRALQQLRQVAMELEIVPVRSEVTLVFARKQFDEQGRIKDDSQIKSANQMLDQVVRYAEALKELRSKG
ncbi:hypothetical protein BH20CHL4_BH20CHL4_10190 [soil metagenome]